MINSTLDRTDIRRKGPDPSVRETAWHLASFFKTQPAFI